VAESTRQNEGLVGNVARLESELKSVQMQLARKELERDSRVKRWNELAERLKATEADLAARTDELYRTREKNGQLRAQLEVAREEMEQYRAALGGLISAFQSGVAGKTDQIVLGGEFPPRRHSRQSAHPMSESDDNKRGWNRRGRRGARG
jgi:chromosome segregation ATPase